MDLKDWGYDNPQCGDTFGILRKKNLYLLSYARDCGKAGLREERDGVSVLMKNAMWI